MVVVVVVVGVVVHEYKKRHVLGVKMEAFFLFPSTCLFLNRFGTSVSRHPVQDIRFETTGSGHPVRDILFGGSVAGHPARDMRFGC